MARSRAQISRRKKYGNVRTRIDNFTFDSKLEARRYGELKLLEKAGEIHDLEIHPRYPLDVNGTRVCTYVADFVYRDTRGTLHVEDVKGMRTALFILKKKLMHAVWGIEVEEVKAG